MYRDTFKSVWSNLDQALGDSSFSSYYVALQRRNTPNKYKSNREQLSITRMKFVPPKRKRDRFVDLLLEARGLDNELDKVMIENVSRHFGSDFLKLESMHLKSHSATVIGQQLKNNENYLNVYLGNNQFGDEGFLLLTRNLQFNRTLIHLDISKSFITPKGFRDSLPYLKPIYTLVSLNLSGNRLSTLGSIALQSLVKDHGNIQFLNLYSTFSDIIKGEFVYYNMGFNSLKNTTSICSACSLDLSENELKDSGIEGIVDHITHWNIQILNLTDCQLTSHGLSRLVDRIVNHKILESLILSKNNFGGQMSCLFKLLSQNNWLEKLTLSYCQIGEFSQISDGLRDNKGLKYLDLSGNRIGEHALCLSLNLQRLHHIKFNDCDLRGNVNHILIRLYYSNCKTLEINQNKIEDLKELKNLLQRNKEILKVSYSHNMVNYKQHQEIQRLFIMNVQQQQENMMPRFKRELERLGSFERETQIVRQKKQELQEKQQQKEDELKIYVQRLEKVKFEQELLTKMKEKELKETQNQLIQMNHQLEQINKQLSDLNNDKSEEKNLYINTKGEQNLCKSLKGPVEKLNDKLEQLAVRKSIVIKDLEQKLHKCTLHLGRLTQEYEKLKG